MAIAMATDSSPDSSLSQDSSESSGEGSLELSYESSSFGSGEESEPEGVHPHYIKVVRVRMEEAQIVTLVLMSPQDY